MKSSEQVEQRIETLKTRREKLRRALENMDGRIASSVALLQKTRERERPQRLVQHIESAGYFEKGWGAPSIWYNVKVQVDGETLTYLSTRRPRVLNAKTRVEASLEFDDAGTPNLTVAPRIEGGKIWIKEYFIEQMKETKLMREATTKSQGVSV